MNGTSYSLLISREATRRYLEQLGSSEDPVADHLPYLFEAKSGEKEYSEELFFFFFF